MDILNHVYKRHTCVRDGLDNGKYTIGFVSEKSIELTIVDCSGVTVRVGLWWKAKTSINLLQITL